MTAAGVIAVLVLVAALLAALWLGARGRDRVAFGLLVAAPLLAGAALAGVSVLPHGATAAAGGSAAATAPTPTTAAEGTAGAGPAAPSAAGGEGSALRQEADSLRAARRYPEAAAAYQRLLAVEPRNADAWADLADAQAAGAGGSLEPGAAAIEQALAVDASHPKALWLKASLMLERQRYAEATDLWQRLLAVLPPDSNDARIVRANLDEARALAAKQGAGR
ncbi:MAG: hypothetical protein JSR73_03760 [Proteobacteria bacterium]|nr:hypothetical protein [Pseudomonadota bacterium]